MLRQVTSWYALDNVEYLLPPPCLEESEIRISEMASEMTISQHICKGFLKYILPEDTVTVDMEVMTLKGIYIFGQDKHSNEKTFNPWSEDHKLPSSFLKRLKETQGKPSRDFLESVMDQNLEPNYRLRDYCTCPKVAKLSDIQGFRTWRQDI